MNNNLDFIITQISENPIFLKLKKVVENIPGWHEHEDVYSHSMTTAQLAQKLREGKFIDNPNARGLFKNFLQEEIDGWQKKDLIVLAALLHDSGKLLSYKEGTTTYPLIAPYPSDPTNTTTCPGHEFWGGEVAVSEILKDIEIPDSAKDYIKNIIKLHDTFNAVPYFTSKDTWSIEELVSDVKARGQGYYKEELFNSLCDCYNAVPFAPAKEAILKLFNTPSLYTKRTYFIG